MSLSSRRVFLISALALASGCGFTPAFGPGGAATRLQNAVLVDEPKDRPGYLLTRHFEERLGQANPARYGFSYAIDLKDEAIAIAATNVITRYNKLGSVTYALRDLDSGQVVISGKVDSFTSYSVAGTTVSAQAAERDAEARLMTILTDLLITRLTADATTLPA